MKVKPLATTEYEAKAIKRGVATQSLFDVIKQKRK
jgi:hypothetical protein